MAEPKAGSPPTLSTDSPLSIVQDHCRSGGRLWLFLDYDGTLVPIAPTPDQAKPDAPLLKLLAQLAASPSMRVAILSGRPLFSIAAMLPVDGLILAGLYGIEIKNPDGTQLVRAEAADLRQTVERVKEAWARLIGGRAGFLVEDKGLAVALHARYASQADADLVLQRAQTVVAQLPTDQYRILGGHRFLEVAPSTAHKGRSVEWLLEKGAFPEALPVYFGDDDKDEEAFSVIREHDGVPVVVGNRYPTTKAMLRLPSPFAVREWLESFVLASQQSRDGNHPGQSEKAATLASDSSTTTDTNHSVSNTRR